MATTILTINAERWLDEVLLFTSGVADALGANYSQSFALPAGLGDVALMSLELRGSPVATRQTTTVPVNGVRAFILSGDATTVVDNVGCAPWLATQDSEIGCYIDPDSLTLWRQTELLSLTSPEMDIHAAPTAELFVYAKVVRVRPIESAARGPVRLVR